MSNAPLMPKATAKWLLQNTILTFDQISDFTQLHPLEVQSIADDETAQHMKPVDPVLMGQLTREEIEKAEKDPAHKLKLQTNALVTALQKPRKGARYTRAHPPARLLGCIGFPDRSSASKAEYQIKQLKPADKRRYAEAMGSRMIQPPDADNTDRVARR